MEFEERYYREELDYLRQLSKLLATEKPHLARFLSEKGADPDIERLLEGFAFLSGKLRQKIDDELPEVTHGLINMLLPGYLRPVPGMTIIEYTPDTDNISAPVKVPRSEQVSTGVDLNNFPGKGVFRDADRDIPPPPCTFTICRDTWLLPLCIDHIENNSSHKYGTIDITFSAPPDADLSQLDLNKLRFWLGNDDDYTRYQLYLWLSEYRMDAELVINGEGIPLPDFSLNAGGFGLQDTLLPWPKNVYSGYRILQEYFCFPEGFFFFDVAGIHSLPAGLFAESFTLRMRFLRPLPVDIKLRQNSLRLYCTPAINLFVHEAEPMNFDHQQAEYPLLASHQHPECYDIFSVNEVVSLPQGLERETDYGKPSLRQKARRWPSFESFNHQTEYSQKREAIYYHHRVKTSLFHKGFDHSIAFVHADQGQPDNAQLKTEIVSVTLTCTNRDLPSQLQVGDINTTDGKNAAVASFRNITRPTETLYPVTDGSLHWSLISGMSLNYLSLLDKEALIQMLQTYDRPGIRHPQSARLSGLKLDALERLETHPIDRLFMGVPVRGLASRLYINPAPFLCEGEMYLLGCVLSHFFSLYASVNSFHELTVVNTETQESWEWKVKIGQHPLM
ncbi:type VI secretion system baseplate subunit TssF [Salmonella enterica]|nr:type VI secretion system baseplate subunit TssF [Salmonella enterica]ECI4153137.1 type VI secretion system baseplate subunit TssF [Salmonella enterica subsp. salamae]HCM1853069.1 type VI secretion system baseplate subunit TssF [Salmonella enterica subsp. salamae serovar 42:z29:-]EAU0241705.1 type VI secretion system baseplate subunit TssF [Salmonella enterica]EAX3604109.1 type VI secretion system baseplate subunit TssF [Salmonella enterica]